MFQQFSQAFGDFTNIDFTAMNNQWEAQHNFQMDSGLQVKMQQGMADPQIQQAFRQYQSQGGPMSFEQFVYGWMATGGYSPQGIQNWRSSENLNQQQEWIAQQGVRYAEARRGQAQAQNSAHFAHNQSIAGQNLMGQAPYTTPMGPQVFSYTLPPGYHPTPQGPVFVNPQGEYFVVDQCGWLHPIYQQRNLPFQ